MNLEIPPGRDKNAVIDKFKAKWYKREIVSAQAIASFVRLQPCLSSDKWPLLFLTLPSLWQQTGFCAPANDDVLL